MPGSLKWHMGTVEAHGSIRVVMHRQAVGYTTTIWKYWLERGVARITGRNAAQRGFHLTRNPIAGWCKVPPVVSLSPAVTFVPGFLQDEPPLWAPRFVRQCVR